MSVNDFNHLILIGRFTADPEIRRTKTDSVYCRFTVANNRSHTLNGKGVEEVSFVRCVAWGKLAEIIGEYCRKGKQVALHGRIKQDTWEGSDGVKHSDLNMVVENMQMLSKGD